MTEHEKLEESVKQEGGVEGYSGPEVGSPLVGGKKCRRGSKKSTKKAPKRKGSKRKGTKKKEVHLNGLCM